jgi:hypothetical protein
MRTFTKIAESQKHSSGLGVSEFVAAVAVVVLLVAVQGMFIDKHPVTLNAAAELGPFGIIAP